MKEDTIIKDSISNTENKEDDSFDKKSVGSK